VEDYSTRGVRFGLLLVFFVAFALRVGLTARFQGLTSPPKTDANSDQYDYEIMAYHLSTGEGYCIEPGRPSASRPPGTSFTLLPIYCVFGRSFLAGRLWICFLSASTCVATGWLAALSFGKRFAVPATLCLTFYPGHFYYVMHYLSETPAALYLTLATGFSVQSLREGRILHHVLAAFFWGAASLTRPNLILAAPLVPLAALAFFRTSWRRDVGNLFLQGAVVVAVVGPWVARNAIVMGKPTLCTVVGGLTFWGAHNEKVFTDPNLRGSWTRTSDLVDADHPLPADELGKDAVSWKYGLEFIRSHEADVPALVGWKLYRLIGAPVEAENKAVYLAFLGSWCLIAPFAGYGFILSWRRCMPGAVGLLIPVLVTIATAVIFYGSERFRDGIAPVLAVYASLGTVGLLVPYQQKRLAPVSQPAE